MWHRRQLLCIGKAGGICFISSRPGFMSYPWEAEYQATGDSKRYLIDCVEICRAQMT